VTAGEQAPDAWPPGPPRYRLSRRQAWFAYPRTDAFGAIRPGAHLAAIRARIAGESAPLAAPPGGPGQAGGTGPADGNAGGTGTGEAGPVDTSGTADLPSATGPQWNPLGPAGVGLGQADLRPRVSGRVVSIAVHPGGQRAYAGTANGGTWYTDDAGQHWRCLDTYAETAPLTGRSLGQADALAVGAVAVEWGADASADVVYVGTGEASRSVDSFFGIGVRVATGPAAANPLDPTVSPWHLEAPDLVNKAIYRMAADPTRPGVVYAATTVGLWRRAGGTAADPAAWTKVFDPTPSGGCTWFDWLTGSSSQAGPVLVETDVVIAPAGGASPQTVYVAVQDVTTRTGQQVWQSPSGDSGSWTAVPGYTGTDRTALAVAPSDPTVVYALSRGAEPPPAPPPPGPPPAAPPPPPPVPTNAARLQGGTFQPIASMPTNLAGGIGHSQSYYDTVVAVDPVAADVIWMGGSAMQAKPGAAWNAALFRGQVTAGAAAGTWTFGFLPANNAAPAADPSWVGGGAHADVHAIEFSGPAATPTAWLGCDGGIFQCPVVTPPPAAGARGVARNTAVGPWQAVNDGLAITQPNYLAQTPVSDSLMLAGTQDNGAEQRIGPAAWKVVQQGDGGGCAIDPGHPNRRFVQYTGFTWYTETDPTRYFAQTLGYSSAAPALKTAWTAENDASAFYSHAAARLLGGGATALAFGSHRVWYCEDWGQHWIPGAPAPDSWRTLPTGTNPFEQTNAAGQPAPNLNQDSLHSMVIRVAFVDDNRLLVLTQAGSPRPGPRPAALYLLTRSGPPWSLAWLSPPDPGQPTPAAPPAGAQNGFPAGEIPVGLAVDTPGPPATCYVTLGTGQDPKHPRIDHVWWYDGTHWWPCGFDATVADTPVNAAVVDADRAVYVGTDVGVWKGVPAAAATPPTWAWSQFSHGLPEAPVVDLVLGQAPHLLRAATHGRGVWELNLGETAPVNQTYLRAHPADTRRAFPAGGNDPDTPTDPPPPARIDASPDIVITGPANPAAPADLPLFRQPRPRYSDSTRVLQYALRRRQLAAPAPAPAAAIVVVDGYFGQRTKNAVIAVQAATPGLTASGVVNAADWQAIVTAPYIDALAGADATYLDMALLDRISPVAGPAGGPSLASLPSSAEVYVQVNARGWPRRPAGTVQVGLLATPAFDATLAGLPALPADWVAQFQAAVTTAPGPWVTGGAPWAWIGSPATIATTRPLHPEEPQVVRFVVTFPLPPGASSMPAGWTLLAFVDDPLDALSSTVTSVHDLITNDWHAAARSVTLVIP
jgi:hypothetical protein